MGEQNLKLHVVMDATISKVSCTASDPSGTYIGIDVAAGFFVSGVGAAAFAGSNGTCRILDFDSVAFAGGLSVGTLKIHKLRSDEVRTIAKPVTHFFLVNKLLVLRKNAESKRWHCLDQKDTRKLSDITRAIRLRNLKIVRF